MRYEGYMITVEYDGDTLTVQGTNRASQAMLRGKRRKDGPVVLTNDQITAVRFRNANAMINGQIVVRADNGDEYTLRFRRKQRDGFAELYEALPERAKQEGMRIATRAFNCGFGDARINRDRIITREGTFSLAGATAEAGSAVDLGKRLTASRVALVGPIALLLRKDRGNMIHVLVTLQDGTPLLLTHTAQKNEGDHAAHTFANNVNRAGRYFADTRTD